MPIEHDLNYESYGLEEAINLESRWFWLLHHLALHVSSAHAFESYVTLEILLTNFVFLMLFSL